jgi:DNA excision repair protein ERCC-2
MATTRGAAAWRRSRPSAALPTASPRTGASLHWAQLETYGALFCRQRGVQEIALALVYFDTETQTETELRQLCSAEALEQALVRALRPLPGLGQAGGHASAGARCRLGGPELPARHLPRRPASARRGGVPRRHRGVPARAGAHRHRQDLGTLFPLLRAMPGQAIDKVAYLTCKGTGRDTALDALSSLRDGAAGRGLRVLAMVSKDQACEHPDKACHGDACPLARGFYDRLAAARQEAVAAGWLDAPAQRRIALRTASAPTTWARSWCAGPTCWSATCTTPSMPTASCGA